MANRVCDRVVQIFGGRGYMRRYAPERFYRELRVDRIWEGSSEVQRMVIAKSLLKRGRHQIGRRLRRRRETCRIVFLVGVDHAAGSVSHYAPRRSVRAF